MAVPPVEIESAIRPVEKSSVKNANIREEDIKKRAPHPKDNSVTEVLPSTPDYMGNIIDIKI